MTYRKELIDVALPLETINKDTAREKSIRHGHPPPCTSGGRAARWPPAAPCSSSGCATSPPQAYTTAVVPCARARPYPSVG